MSKQPDANGPAYLRIYREALGNPNWQEFAALCVEANLPAPTQRMYKHVRSLCRHAEPRYRPMNEFDQEKRDRRRVWSIERVEALVRQRQRESIRLDFKKEPPDASKLRRTLASMANSGGGEILIGIAEANSAAASIAPTALGGREEWVEQVNKDIDPPVQLETFLLPMAEGVDEGIIVIRVRPADWGVVHFADGKALVRRGTTTTYMTSSAVCEWARKG